MSQPSLGPATSANPQSPAPATQKQRLNVYTMMLVLSFICLVTASIVLHLELKKWGEKDWWKTNAEAPKPQTVIVTPN